jgi:hypothetical protein
MRILSSTDHNPAAGRREARFALFLAHRVQKPRE